MSSILVMMKAAAGVLVAALVCLESRTAWGQAVGSDLQQFSDDILAARLERLHGGDSPGPEAGVARQHQGALDKEGESWRPRHQTSAQQPISRFEGSDHSNAGGRAAAPSRGPLAGKIAFVAGVSDSSGFGWAVAKELHRAGATILLGTWVPMVQRFERALQNGSLDQDMQYETTEGSKKMSIAKVYALDVAFDRPEDIPDEIRNDRKFRPMIEANRGFSIHEVAKQVEADFGKINFLVHAIANGPEVGRPLLATSRRGYLAAQASSAYSLISLLQAFTPLMKSQSAAEGGDEGGAAVVSLTYIASERVVPGYGGGMSSAKAALESDTRTLAYELGRDFGIRVNTVSAGPLKSRAANAIRAPGEKKSFIDLAIAYNEANAPLSQSLEASDVGKAVLFLLSPSARAITGVTLYVDNGMHVMGMAADSNSLKTTTR